jgi:uncharacterized protein
MRVILDTNLLISALLSKNLRERLEIVVIEPNLNLLVCNELLDEFYNVIQRPKFNKYISQSQLNDYMNFLQPKFNYIQLISKIDIYRDHADNFLLALAKDGNADYLITGDNDLLVLSNFEQTRIVTLTTYMTINKH